MYALPVANRTFTSEIEMKRSRFLGHIRRVQSEAEAREFIHAVRQKFPDARHHCSAFIFHVDDAQPVERFSDDGEPSGTAGGPMLGVLQGSGLLDVAAVVVRYFGGVKLGTGGLVRAYSDAVSETLQRVETTTRSRQDVYRLRVDHGTGGRLEAELRARGITVLETQCDAQIEFLLAVEPGADLEAEVSALTSGSVAPTKLGQRWVE